MNDITTQTIVNALLMTQSSFRQAIQRSIKKHNIDLTFEMLQIMMRIWRQEGLNQQELANQTFKDKVSLSYLINNLEKKGLVKRQSDTEDRRNKRIFLTPQGLELRERVMPLIQQLYTNADEKAHPEHLEKCHTYLEELNDIFKNSPAC